MTELQFFRGLKDSYDVDKHGSGIYFATDTGEIIHNDKSYSGLTPEVSGITNIQQTHSNSIQIEFANGETTEINSGVYQSSLDEDITIGDTNVGELNGKKYNEILDMLLFPVEIPTVKIEPSITGFVLNPQVELVELGTSVSSITNAALNKGQWSDGTDYTGDRIANIYYFNGIELATLDEYKNQTYQLGDNIYSVVVNYGEGKKPKNSRGEEVDLRCPSGQISTTRVVNATLPWYIEDVKQDLIPWSESMQTESFELKPHTKENPQSFSLPRKATNIYTFSSISAQNDGVGIGYIEDNSAWEEVIEDNGYFTYYYKGSNRGSVKMIVKF